MEKFREGFVGNQKWGFIIIIIGGKFGAWREN